ITRKRPHVCHRTRLRLNSSRQWRLFHPFVQRAVRAGHRERREIRRKPRLFLRVRKQRHKRPRRHQIVPRQSRPIRLNHVAIRNSRLRIKRRRKFLQILRRRPAPLLPRRRPQQHFRVQVLADFVHQLHRVLQRNGHVLRQHRARRLIWVRLVSGPHFALNLNSAFRELLRQQVRRLQRRLLNRQHQLPRRTFRRQYAADYHGFPARLPGQPQIFFLLRTNGGDLVLHDEFLSRRRNLHRDRIVGLLPSCQRHGHGIVVHHDRRNRRSVLPHHVVNFPTARITLPWEITVVADHISRNLLHAAHRNRVRQLRQGSLWRPVKLFLGLIRKLPIRQIGISPPHQNQISGKFPIRGQCAVGLDRGAKPPLRPKRVQRQRRRQQLHIRSRQKILVGVLLIQRPATLRVHHQQPPLPFVHGSRAQQSLSPFRKSRRRRTRPLPRTLLLRARKLRQSQRHQQPKRSPLALSQKAFHNSPLGNSHGLKV